MAKSIQQNLTELETNTLAVANKIKATKSFERSKQANETAAKTFSQANPNVFVYTVEA